jgi:hypothetical protein
MLINLLPSFPFDGGNILRAGLLLLRPDMDRQRAAAITFWVAVSAAGLLAAAALILWKHNTDSFIPMWFALALIAAVLLLGARHELAQTPPPDAKRRLPHEKSFVCSSSETDASSVVPGSVTRWLEQRRVAKDRHRRDIEAQEEHRVDEILGRLHAEGMDSLSEQDRLLLQRVSARYRRRLSNRA